ncbi:MAG: carbamoyltransferase HypF [Bacteroidales bacterium]|nr:carbamoyltransferase HypF [Bacteroidales bacterium]
MQVIETYKLMIYGLVQGVGFRPYIYRLAYAHRLKGWVENRTDGVILMINATHEGVLKFKDEIVHTAPVASAIESIEIVKAGRQEFSSFEIRNSEDISDAVTEISPDIAVCPECLYDMKEQPHRKGYPLINCTHCGPRFSIISDLPYDRPNTTMALFEMCPVCRAEYTDVSDRRFHAQPISCNHCGPVYRLETTGGQLENMDDILSKVKDIVAGGGLLAIKGTGGFHLICNAFSEEGVKRLRNMKRRNGKPFALMFRSADEARKFVKITRKEEEVLTSWRRPIVLLRKKRNITKGIADGLSTLGVMLPYMPFHHQLFEHLDTPAVVMTSGNFTDEPILISNEKATRMFAGYVDGVISYNREIFNRIDDSVLAITGKETMVLRRARAFAPSPIRTGIELEGILGTGAELTSTFCMGKGHQAFMSQYIGDLKNLETLEFYREIYGRFCRMFRFSPDLVVSDLHPDYMSSRFARQLSEEAPNIQHISVQHHHAHIASGMLDAGLEGEVLGFSFDGTGLGSDGHSWGAEVLQAGYLNFERLFHFEYIPLPGGDKASLEPWRMGLSYLYRCFGDDLYELQIPLVKAIDRKDIGHITRMIDQKLNTPLASSAGRLFDALAAITGLNYYSSYQAEAPMLLESVLDPSEKGVYEYEIDDKQVSFSLMIKSVVEDIHDGLSTGRISAKFHNTVVNLIFQLSKQIRIESGMNRIVLGGGTFQNRYLTRKVMDKLKKERFDIYLPHRIPMNDQGIAAGQIAIGAHRRKLM